MDQIEKALAGVQAIERGILCIHHPEEDSPEVIDQMFVKGTTLCAEWDVIFTIVVMPKGLSIPTEVRERVQRNLKAFEGRLQHIAFVAENSTILSLAFRFVAALNPYWKYSLHKTLEDALARIREIRRMSS